MFFDCFSIPGGSVPGVQDRRESAKRAEKKQKKGKLLASHRYDLLPLLHSCPGGIQRELVV